MQKLRGFTLLEVLLVSLLGSVLLLAATELLASLSQQQARNYAQLRLQDNAQLAAAAISRDITTATAVLAAGVASQPYPNRSATSVDLTGFELTATGFNQFRSSDWLFLQTKAETDEDEDKLDYSLWHLDEKTYGFGLAHKGRSRENPDSLTASQTLVDQVELLRFRFYCRDQGRWLSALDITAYSSITHIQFALLLVSSTSVGTAPIPLSLWSEQLIPPDDGHLRLLVTGIRSLATEESE